MLLVCLAMVMKAADDKRRRRRRRLCSGAVALGKRACLDAGWRGESEGMLGFVGGVTGSELAPAGPPPLPLCH
jgi:hypothetical protein